MIELSEENTNFPTLVRAVIELQELLGTPKSAIEESKPVEVWQYDLKKPEIDFPIVWVAVPKLREYWSKYQNSKDKGITVSDSDFFNYLEKGDL